jgi:osmotically-inducible protein OsmY
MGKRHFPLAWLLFLGVGALEGCSRQDTECLSSIGRKILERASATSAGCRDRLEGLKSSRIDTNNLQDRVTLRLRWEKVLADTPIEVVVTGQEIELKGTVKTVEQRTRAVELAESTSGVDRVLVSLTMGEPPSPMEKKDE